MEVEFSNQDLSRLEVDERCTGGWSPAIVKAFRKRLQLIRAAPDVRDFYSLKSLHFEKLKGDRKGQHSMRLNDQFRLILELVPAPASEAKPERTVIRIVAVDDYH